MPLQQRTAPPANPRAENLRTRLIEEWKSPNAAASEPLIIEEAPGGGKPTRLYVVWDAWGQMHQQDRSELILDAYEAVRGHDAAQDVIVALGVTQAEARRMGIQ